MSRSNVPGLEPAPTKNAKLVQWVRDIAELAQIRQFFHQYDLHTCPLSAGR